MFGLGYPSNAFTNRAQTFAKMKQNKPWSDIADLPKSLKTNSGTTVRLCPLNRTVGIPIYCSRSGLFFSYATGALKKVNPYANRHFKCKRNVHSDYPKLQHYLGNARCHILMALTWLEHREVSDEKGNKMVVDHINGNIFDWSASNLQWVTPRENHRRAKILRNLRQSGFDPTTRTAEELLTLFNLNNVAGDVYAGD